MRSRMALPWRSLLLSVIAAILALVASVASQAPAPMAVRISCGATQDYQTIGHDWSKDYGYSGGSVGNLTLQKAREMGYSSFRYFSSADGPNNCYNVSVPNGNYLLRMFFSYGLADNDDREPQFDVSIEGTLAYSLKPGWSISDDTSYYDSLIFVDEMTATACFHNTGHGSPAIVTLEILQLYENAYDLGFGPENHLFLLNAMARISCGATKAAYGTTLLADPWGGDRYWSQDMNRQQGINVGTLDTGLHIRHSNVPPNFYPEAIYQGATVTTMGSLVSYAFPIEASRNYSIWLHFAEIDPQISGPGQRIFDILYNDQYLFSSVDIWVQAGGSYAAVVLNRTVLVDGNTLTLTFRPVIGNILVCAIEVYQIMERELPTRSPEVWALQALKPNLGVPPRMGWKGDPCVPQEHPWKDVDCKLDYTRGFWLIDGLSAANEGLKGSLTNDITAFTSIDHIILASNTLQGPLPDKLGTLASLTRLDLSNNLFNGSIPANLGNLSNLTQLYLNNNQLTGEVPAALAAGPVRGASFNFLGNPGLCGIPSLRPCKQISAGAVVGIVLAVLLGICLLLLLGYVVWKRKENVARANKILMAGDAPYAASHTQTRFSAPKDVQLHRFGSFTEQRLMRVDSNPSMTEQRLMRVDSNPCMTEQRLMRADSNLSIPEP